MQWCVMFVLSAHEAEDLTDDQLDTVSSDEQITDGPQTPAATDGPVTASMFRYKMLNTISTDVWFVMIGQYFKIWCKKI